MQSEAESSIEPWIYGSPGTLQALEKLWGDVFVGKTLKHQTFYWKNAAFWKP